ncbi:MAG: MnhB domain-containing protein [Melioribacteraceae bacterium]|nr:MnhB domain-containing protein [Melioribacteraceae bacterium]
MKQSSDSPIILLLSRVISPYIMLFGLYVIFHGHYSPGGGFQGGAMLAASILLIRISAEEKVYELQFKKSFDIPLGALGVLIFLGVGLIAMLLGGNFLDYHFLPMDWMPKADVRAMGILLIEVGVGLAVMTILVAIYDNLLEDEDA